MPEEHKIVDVMTGEISPGVPGWAFITLRPDGKQWQHSVAAECLEWRAAEYGLTDPAEILDVILHELYQEPEEASRVQIPMRSVREPQKAVQAVRRTTSDRYGPKVQHAESTQAAREAHRSRIAAVKRDRVKVSDPDGLLAHVHQGHGMDPDRVRAKAEAVDVRRWANLYGGLPVSPNSVLDEIRKKEQR
jgi:hypothetical protein